MAQEEVQGYELKRNDKVGRHGVACRDLPAGGFVLSELPVAVGPKVNSPPLCLGCYSPVDIEALVVCTSCGWPVCGPDCETNTEHKLGECEVFASSGVRYQPETEEQLTYGSPQYECITPLRYLVLLNGERDQGRWKKEVLEMESHTEKRKESPEWEREHVNVVEFLRRKCKLADRFSEEIIHRMIGVLEVNAFEVRTENGSYIRGLYPQTAIMSHSCVANCTHTIYPSDNYRSKVRTTIPVPEGGELYVSYTSSIQPTILRRDALSYSKYFDCDCPRCADPTELGTHLSTIKCNKCDNGLITSSNPLDQEAVWKCSHCEFSIRAETLLKIFRMIQSEVDQVGAATSDPDAQIHGAESLLRKYRSVLHPRNVYMISLRHTLLQLYGRAPGYTFDDLPDILLERKIELCQQVLDIVDVVKPGLNRFRGLILYELHVPLMLFNRHRYEYNELSKEEFKKSMEEVARILQESVEILAQEDEGSPEEVVAAAGKESLRELKDSIKQL